MGGKQFAFGADEFNDCHCPAITAGKSTDGMLGIVIQTYDANLREETGERAGVVDEATAREAWEDAVDHWNGDMAGYPEEEIEAAVAIGNDVLESVF